MQVPGTGCWPGAGRLTAGLQGTPPAASQPRGALGANPSDSHGTHSAAPSSSLSGLVSLSCCCNQTIQPRGPGLLLHKGVDSVNCVRAREQTPAAGRAFTLQVQGLLARGAPSDFVHPEASSVRAYTGECELSEKHAFWHRVRDITHFIGSEALL